MLGKQVARILVISLLALSVIDCGGRRNRGSACSIPVNGACPACRISCPVGQAAVCTPGEADASACKAPPSCTCN